MAEPCTAWSESRLERQSSMSPDGIASRLPEDEPADRPASARPRRRRRDGVQVALWGVVCIALAALALYGLARHVKGG